MLRHKSRVRPGTAAERPALPPDRDLVSGRKVSDLESHLDRIDAELLSLIRRRTALARQIAAARAADGRTRFVHERELAVVHRFRQLGPLGRDLATILLRLGR